MKLIQFFLQVLFFSCVISRKECNFIYDGFHRAEDISPSGTSYIRSDGILTITNDSAKLFGHAFYSSPLQFKDDSVNNSYVASFSTTFIFAIRPKYPDLGGHGLAFVISSIKEMKGISGTPALGPPNDTSTANLSSTVLAVEFDIIQNLELFDVDDNHVGININSLISNISASAAYLTGNNPKDKQSIHPSSGSAIQVWIEYNDFENVVNVTLSPLGIPKSDWPLISFPIDLSLIFSEYMYVGFSASTGLITAPHNVLGWSFEVGGKTEDYLDPSKLPPIDPHSCKVVNSKGFAAGISLACISLVLLVMFGMYQVAQRMGNGDDELLEEWEVECGAHRFDYSELSTAMRGFRDQNLNGCGGFRRVYRGVVPSTGLEVAIKRVAHDSRQGMREFIAEITSGEG